MSDNFSFIFGMLLVGLNPLVGYGGIILFAFLFKRSKQKVFIFLGAGAYIFSWGMLVAGTMLAGPRSLKIARTFIEENLVFTVIVAAVILIFWMAHRYRGKQSNGKNTDQQ